MTEDSRPACWRITPDGRIAWFVNGKLVPARGIPVEYVTTIEGSQPPRHPELLPTDLDELNRWLEEGRPEVFKLIVAESDSPLTAAQLHRRAERYGWMTERAAKELWPAASKLLRNDPHIYREGAGGGTQYRYSREPRTIAPPKKKVRRAAPAVTEWLNREADAPPLSSPTAEVVASLNSLLARFRDEALSDRGSVDWDAWETRLDRAVRIHALLRANSAIDRDVLFSAVEQALRAGQQARGVAGLLMRIFLRLSDGNLRSLPPRFAALVFEQVLDRDADTLGETWTNQDWDVATAHSRSRLKEGSPDLAVWLFRIALERRLLRHASAIARVLDGGDASVWSREAGWRTLAVLERVRVPRGMRPPGAIQDLMHRLIRRPQPGFVLTDAVNVELDGVREEVRVELRASLHSQQSDLTAQRRLATEAQQAADERLRTAQLAEERANARVKEAEHSLAEMRRRLEQVRMEGRDEGQFGSLRIIASAAEAALDAGVGSAAVVRALDAELRARGVWTVHQRGDVIDFDAAIYEWLAAGEPPPRVRVARRAYIFGERGRKVLLQRGLCHGT